LIARISVRDSRNFFSNARFASSSRFDRTQISGKRFSASTLSLSAGCASIDPNKSFSRHIRSASCFAAKIHPQRNPPSP
jgi:hypothetical protein